MIEASILLSIDGLASVFMGCVPDAFGAVEYIYCTLFDLVTAWCNAFIVG